MRQAPVKLDSQEAQDKDHDNAGDHGGDVVDAPEQAGDIGANNCRGSVEIFGENLWSFASKNVSHYAATDTGNDADENGEEEVVVAEPCAKTEHSKDRQTNGVH